jgi:hypothetical protein
MKLQLSEAIRLGAMLRPQVRGRLFAHGGSCALGAAKESIGMKGKRMADGSPFIFTSYWEWLGRIVTCPGCKKPGAVESTVICLNDEYRWTREQIAAWVETIEPPAEPAVMAEEPEAVHDSHL